MDRPERVDLLVPLLAWWAGALLLVWLSLSLGLWVVALGRPSLADSRCLRVLTIPGSRRLTQGLLAAGMLAACSTSPPPSTAPRIEVLGPVDATAPNAAFPGTDAPGITNKLAPVPSQVGSPSGARRLSEPAIREPLGPGGTSLGPISVPEIASPDAGEPVADDPLANFATHEVVPGDNLWIISESHLSILLGRRPGNAEVARYWVGLIEANARRFRSGDPNLIYPGEVIVLPPGD